jgi:hypothetical protein
MEYSCRKFHSWEVVGEQPASLKELLEGTSNIVQQPDFDVGIDRIEELFDYSHGQTTPFACLVYIAERDHQVVATAAAKKPGVVTALPRACVAAVVSSGLSEIVEDNIQCQWVKLR